MPSAKCKEGTAGKQDTVVGERDGQPSIYISSASEIYTVVRWD